jgi:uncharacterized protein YciI
MKTFFCKITPPRSTFAADMSEAERKVMQEHAAYWKSSMDEGRVVVFGPVDAPNGTYGIGIIEVGDTADAIRFMSNDPALKANLGFTYDVYAMPRAVSRP